MSDLVYGFEPFCDVDSRLLILGSFPSVKSRAQSFYYGNPQNAFWRILSAFFKQPLPVSVEEKKLFLRRNKIALWDIVTSCEIVGSADSTIKNYSVADLKKVMDISPIEKIILNGGTAYKIFLKYYKNIAAPYIKLPSTSPANARAKDEEWCDELSRTFK
ncbi:MAG TPA: DNA-deoxyinosine glycosylase [Candidatus Coproplasma avicola]|uniref:DNA-deoxyinosine glycosylase n=1 Tax=Candidatus Coproplasma avicola TaxID=2840744 RepID=A0A9D1E6F5_9FIRM|nr:DNA-deoxyinosine glycosylase [Candidatus Coproplasma avicola]